MLFNSLWFQYAAVAISYIPMATPWIHFCVVIATYLATGRETPLCDDGNRTHCSPSSSSTSNETCFASYSSFCVTRPDEKNTSTSLFCSSFSSHNGNAYDEGAMACRALDRNVSPLHAFAPTALCNVVTLITHAPSLLLLSRVRVGHMHACMTSVCLLIFQIVATYLSFSYLSPMLTYALALHFAVFFLSLAHRHRAPLIGDDADRTLRGLCLAGLLLACWRYGPPLPCVDVFGFSGGCGAQAHMLGFFYAGVACPVVLAVAERLMHIAE